MRTSIHGKIFICDDAFINRKKKQLQNRSANQLATFDAF